MEHIYNIHNDRDQVVATFTSRDALVTSVNLHFGRNNYDVKFEEHGTGIYEFIEIYDKDQHAAMVWTVKRELVNNGALLVAEFDDDVRAERRKSFSEKQDRVLNNLDAREW